MNLVLGSPPFPRTFPTFLEVAVEPFPSHTDLWTRILVPLASPFLTLEFLGVLSPLVFSQPEWLSRCDCPRDGDTVWGHSEIFIVQAGTQYWYLVAGLYYCLRCSTGALGAIHRPGGDFGNSLPRLLDFSEKCPGRDLNLRPLPV